MKLKPLGTRLLVRPIVEKHKGMIQIPEAYLERATCGDVIAVGRDVADIAPGDRVLFNMYAGTQIRVDDAPVTLMTTEDIVAKVDKPQTTEPHERTTNRIAGPIVRRGGEPPACIVGAQPCTCECS